MDDEPPGITVENLPDTYREGFLCVMEMAHALHDPSEQWRDFTECVWQGLSRVFGVMGEEGPGIERLF